LALSSLDVTLISSGAHRVFCAVSCVRRGRAGLFGATLIAEAGGAADAERLVGRPSHGSLERE
jgi:hypothetical protein